MGCSPANGGAHVWGACGRPDSNRDRHDNLNLRNYEDFHLNKPAEINPAR